MRPRRDTTSTVVFVVCVSFVIVLGWTKLKSEAMTRDAREREDRLITLFRFTQGADDGR